MRFFSLALLCVLSWSCMLVCVVSERTCPQLTQRLQQARENIPPLQRKPRIFFADTEGVNFEMYKTWFGTGHYQYCPYDCEVVSSADNSASDRERLLASSEAVIFWATPRDKFEPHSQWKCAGQLWLQASTEAFDHSILDRTFPGTPDSPIDLEISWRRTKDADKVIWLNNADWNYPPHRLLVVPTPPIAKKKQKEHRGDQAAIAAFISNCGATSPRLQILEEMQKYVKVDSFGGCLKNKEIPEEFSDTSFGLLAQKNNVLSLYKMLLSFENHEQNDYVTEKFYHPFTVGTLPVVLGAPNIHEYNPSVDPKLKSFVNYRDFPDTKTFAEYLDYLDKNDTAYLEYFQWKSLGDISPFYKRLTHSSWRDAPCQVCMKIHEKLYGTKPVDLYGLDTRFPYQPEEEANKEDL